MNKITPPDQPISLQNNEIDLLKIIHLLWQKRILFLSIVSLSIILAIIFNIFTPKTYKCTTTLIINEENTSSLGYTSILGLDSSSNLEQNLLNILQSHRIKESIAQVFLDEFKTELQEKEINNPRLQRHYIIHNKLKLDKKVSFFFPKNNNLKTISYENKNIHYSKKVIEEYLNQLSILNDQLNISSQKHIYILIDPPKLPLTKYKPNLLLNILTAIILSSLLSLIYIVLSTKDLDKELIL